MVHSGFTRARLLCSRQYVDPDDLRYRPDDRGSRVRSLQKQRCGISLRVLGRHHRLRLCLGLVAVLPSREEPVCRSECVRPIPILLAATSLSVYGTLWLRETHGSIGLSYSVAHSTAVCQSDSCLGLHTFLVMRRSAYSLVLLENASVGKPWVRSLSFCGTAHLDIVLGHIQQPIHFAR